MTRRAGDVVGLAVAWVIAAGCVRLGFWQVSRLHERRASNASIEARMALPPIDAAARGMPRDSVVGRRVRVRGAWDYAAEKVWTERSYEGVPGVALITPVRLDDGAFLFVDRGWVPSPDAATVNAAAWREGDSADVTGLAYAIPRARGDVDSAAAAARLGAPVLPYVAVALSVDSAHAATTPRRWPPPVLGDGPHGSYAIQWFSFALIILAGSVVLYRKRRRDERSGAGAAPGTPRGTGG